MKQNSEIHDTGFDEAYQSLCRGLAGLNDSKAVKQLLEDLCTPAELEAMIDRWRVVLLLEQGKTYREINSLTGVSVTTVGRVARFLNYGAGGYRLALQQTGNRAD